MATAILILVGAAGVVFFLWSPRWILGSARDPRVSQRDKH